MSDQKEWEESIERIKRCGAGEYGSGTFMCIKHEHWKMLWAAERIAELEQQLAELAADYHGERLRADSLFDQLAELRKMGMALCKNSWYHHGTKCVNDDDFNNFEVTLLQE